MAAIIICVVMVFFHGLSPPSSLVWLCGEGFIHRFSQSFEKIIWKGMAILSCSIQLAAWPKEFLSRMQAFVTGRIPGISVLFGAAVFPRPALEPAESAWRTLMGSFAFPVQPSPFSPLGFYFSSGEKRVGRLALHHAGAFYLQEPSASSAVTVLAPQRGNGYWIYVRRREENRRRSPLCSVGKA